MTFPDLFHTTRDIKVQLPSEKVCPGHYTFIDLCPEPCHESPDGVTCFGKTFRADAVLKFSLSDSKENQTKLRSSQS